MPSVVIDKSDITSLRNSLSAIKSGTPDAIRFATNDTLVGARTESARLIGERITAKITRIKAAIEVKKMFVSDMTADITCQGDPLNLIHYKTSKTMKGVKAQVFKPGTTKLIKHSFMATMKSGHEGESGHKGVFWRKEKVKGTGKWPVGKYRKLPPPPGKGIWSPLKEYQLKIIELYGPRIPDIFGDDKTMEAVLKHADIRYQARLNYHTDRLIDKARSA